MTTNAYQAGRYARLAARGQDTCPRYGITPEARQEVAQWRRGWEDQDREMAHAGVPPVGTTVAPRAGEPARKAAAAKGTTSPRAAMRIRT